MKKFWPIAIIIAAAVVIILITKQNANGSLLDKLLKPKSQAPNNSNPFSNAGFNGTGTNTGGGSNNNPFNNPSVLSSLFSAVPSTISAIGDLFDNSGSSDIATTSDYSYQQDASMYTSGLPSDISGIDSSTATDGVISTAADGSQTVDLSQTGSDLSGYDPYTTDFSGFDPSQYTIL